MAYFVISFTASFKEDYLGIGNGNFDGKDCNNIIIGNAKNRCIWSNAVHNDDLNLCESINTSEVKVECFDFIYRNRGIRNKDAGLCELISDVGQKSICVTEIKRKQNNH